jgi:4-nitrophenyl phosphatase/NagD protein
MAAMTEKLKYAKCFLFDMDGTIYLGSRLLPGAADFVAYLDQIGFPYFFLTNNSSRSRADYVTKLGELGLPTPPEKIFSSGEATAIYLSKQQPRAKIYLVGTPSLEDEFARFGFELTDQEPDYVVLGFDTTLTYEKLVKLCDFVRAGLPYIATHPDINCPVEGGFIPDIGAMMALVESSTGRAADLIVGKPHAPIVKAIVEKTGFAAEEIIMVGDRLYTDIALGAAGLGTVLVLSGEAKMADLPAAPHQPDLICDHLGDLHQWFLEMK